MMAAMRSAAGMSGAKAVQKVGEPLHGDILFSEVQVDRRIDAMASEIVIRYKGQRVLFVGLLKGGLPFAAKLMTAIVRADPRFHPNLELIGMSRYGENREPGETTITTPLRPKYHDLRGYRVVLVEDLLDSGGTIQDARMYLSQFGAPMESIDAIVLLRKKKNPPSATQVTMIGFDDVADQWLTGMGCDDERLGTEANRWAAYIAVANPVAGA